MVLLRKCVVIDMITSPVQPGRKKCVCADTPNSDGFGHEGRFEGHLVGNPAIPAP
jgi:hypothetical protein